MNEKLQIKALAELDGWTWRKSASPYQQDGWWSSDNRGPFTENQMMFASGFRRVNTSYDTIIPLIQKHGHEISNKVYHMIYNKQGYGSHVFDATPSQLAEALLRATGKWID